MTGIDTAIASVLASRVDTLLNVSPGSRTAAAQAGASELSVDTPSGPAGAAALGEAAPPASAQAVLSEVALTLDAISRFGGEATPAVLGETPIWPAPPAINVPAGADGGLFPTENAAADGAASGQAAASGQSAAAGQASASGSANAAQASTAAGTATSAATVPVDALAAALETTVSESGLFYESHLAQWLGGTFPPEALANEPQTRLAAEASQLPLDWTGSDESSHSAAADSGLSAWLGEPVHALAAMLTSAVGPQRSFDAQGPQSAFGAQPHAGASAYATPGSPSARLADSGFAGDAQFGAASARAGAAQAAAPASIAASIHPATISLVRQQLDLLATEQFRWTGQVWPGAKLDWTIEPDEARREHGSRGGEDGEETPWRTRLTLALPSLGTVDADLVLTGTRLIARVQASPGGAARLVAGGAAFGKRLQAAGIELAGLSIREIGGGAPAAGATAQAAASVYARAAAAAADAEARDVPEEEAVSSAAGPFGGTGAATAATPAAAKRPVSPLDHLFDDPFDWGGA